MWVLGKELRVWTKAEKSTWTLLFFSHCPPLLPHLQGAIVCLSPSCQAHLHIHFLRVVTSLSLKHSPRKEKMLQERGTSVKYPLERFHHAQYCWLLSLSLSLDPLPLYLTVILSTSHCALPFLLEPCEIDQCGGGVGGLLVQLDGGFDIFKAKNKLRLGTGLLTCTWLLAPYYHPETNIQLPKDTKMLTALSD